MTSPQDIADLLRHRLNFADVRILAQSVRFQLNVDDLGIDLHGWQTSIYHPIFDALVMESKHHGLVLAQNTYLSSFAYNVIAAWDYYFDDGDSWKTDFAHPLGKALRMNFKKFFAEQILRRTQNLFGIGMLLETLLYEEEIMYPVLVATRDSQQISGGVGVDSSKDLKSIADWMTGLVLYHELGHIVRRELPNFRALLLEDFPEAAQRLPAIWDLHGASAEEFECDAFAVGMALHSSEPSLTKTEAYRLTILGFVIFAALHALDLSAKATAIDSPAEAEDPDRENIFNAMGGGTYSIGTYQMLQRDRSQAVRLLVEGMAALEGADVYGSHGRFRIPHTLIEDLENFIPTIVDGTDIRIRGKCEMMARALHGYRQGIEYLAWRSKMCTGSTEANQV